MFNQNFSEFNRHCVGILVPITLFLAWFLERKITSPRICF